MPAGGLAAPGNRGLATTSPKLLEACTGPSPPHTLCSDGIFGPKTAAGVVEFQMDAIANSADGVVGQDPGRCLPAGGCSRDPWRGPRRLAAPAGIV